MAKNITIDSTTYKFEPVSSGANVLELTNDGFIEVLMLEKILQELRRINP